MDQANISDFISSNLMKNIMLLCSKIKIEKETVVKIVLIN